MGFEALNSHGLHVGWQGDDKTDDSPSSAETCFELLSQWHLAGCICCLSGFDQEFSRSHDSGIVGGHDYSLLRIEQPTPGLCMLQMRNPWGHSGWDGKFSSTDTQSWTEELRHALGFDPAASDDGTFWIEASDMFKHFEGVNKYTRVVDVVPTVE